MSYNHTQWAPLHWLLYAIALGLVVGYSLADLPPPGKVVLLVAAIVTLVLAFSFQSLTISDEGDRLRVAYGPLPLFQKTIMYDNITSVDAARSSLVDGWGIHWVPGRGWTYNLWGFDCVEVRSGRRLIRVGTDDPETLSAFLENQISTTR
jgi:hypothetical protein